MSKTFTITAVALTLALVAGLTAFQLSNTSTTLGAGWIGSPVFIQSATTTTVGPDTRVTLFDSSASCKSRVITTRGSAIVVTFGDTTGYASTSLALTGGHMQGASSTVAYDAGLYGCGLMSALGYSSTTITTSHF